MKFWSKSEAFNFRKVSPLHELLLGRHGILDIFMDVSHTLEMAICVVNQLKNDSYF